MIQRWPKSDSINAQIRVAHAWCVEYLRPYGQSTEGECRLAGYASRIQRLESSVPSLEARGPRPEVECLGRVPPTLSLAAGKAE